MTSTPAGAAGAASDAAGLASQRLARGLEQVPLAEAVPGVGVLTLRPERARGRQRLLRGLEQVIVAGAARRVSLPALRAAGPLGALVDHRRLGST